MTMASTMIMVWLTPSIIVGKARGIFYLEHSLEARGAV